MGRLDNLARARSKCDVVALTGDWAGVLPAQWDQWPQRFKLSVPGNHDSANFRLCGATHTVVLGLEVHLSPVRANSSICAATWR
jgi:hypothetical protein